MDWRIKFNADGFADTYRLLYKRTKFSSLLISKSKQDMRMIMPTFVNGALSCELYLKYLLDVPCKSHKIIELINKLDGAKPGYKAKIENMTVCLMHTNHNAEYTSENYERDLSAINNAFVNLRYWYEPSKEVDCSYSQDFLDVFLAVLSSLAAQCEKN